MKIFWILVEQSILGGTYELPNVVSVASFGLAP